MNNFIIIICENFIIEIRFFLPFEIFIFFNYDYVILRVISYHSQNKFIFYYINL